MTSSPTASTGSTGSRAPDWSARLRLLGAGLLVALPVAMWIANRSAPLMFGLAAMALLAGALMAEGLSPVLRRLRAALLSPVGLALALFVLWALVSISWSHRPLAAVSMWGEFAVPLICALAIVSGRRPRRDENFERALALALIVAALLMMFELAVGLSQRVMLGLGKGLTRTDVFNRPVLTSLILTAAVLPGLWVRGRTKPIDRVLCLVAALSVATATLVSESGAAKLGLLILIVTWGLTLLVPRLALAAVAVGFATTMLTAPVIGEIAEKLIPETMHQRLADSHSRARVDIWLTFGEAIRKHPLVGSGFGSSASLNTHPVAASISPPHREMLAVGHPHSAPIQAWTETGAIGAALLGFAGLACLARLRRLSAGAMAPRLALFAAAFGVASVGHGAWQGWWIAALAAGAAILWLNLPETAPLNVDRDNGHG